VRHKSIGDSTIETVMNGAPKGEYHNHITYQAEKKRRSKIDSRHIGEKRCPCFRNPPTPKPKKRTKHHHGASKKRLLPNSRKLPCKLGSLAHHPLSGQGGRKPKKGSWPINTYNESTEKDLTSPAKKEVKKKSHTTNSRLQNTTPGISEKGTCRPRRNV